MDLNLRKRKVILVLSLIFLVSILQISFAQTANTYKPLIVVDSLYKTQELIAGDRSIITVPVGNESGTSASNVEVTIKGDHPFIANAMDLVETIPYVTKQQVREVEFDLVVSPKAQSRTYDVTIEFKFKNAYGDYYTQTDILYINIDNENIEPIIGIESYINTLNSTLYKQKVEDVLLLNIVNDGTLEAKDLRISIEGMSNDTIILNGDVDTKIIQEIKPGDKKYIYFDVMAGSDASSGTKELIANIEYIDEFGENYLKKLPIYIEVEGNDSSSVTLDISDISLPQEIEAGSEFEVSLNVRNDSNITVEYLEISPDYTSEFISKSTSKEVLRDLGPGESMDVEFLMMAKKDTASESYDMYINFTYYAKGDNIEDSLSTKEYVGIFVNGEGATSKPKLIIDNYQYGGDSVLAGENFDLVLDIKNTSKNEATQNIKVTIDSADGVFIPVDSSSSFYVDHIGASQINEETITLKTKVDASVKIYQIEVTMEYEDGSGNAYDSEQNPYSEKETLSIAVNQPIRLQPAEIVVPYEVGVGESFYVEQEFYNMGKAPMYNMIINLEGVNSNEATYFVGNFEAGASDYFSAQAYVDEEGEYNSKIIYQFEDALGNLSVIEEEFTINAVQFDYSYEEMPNDGDYQEFYGEEMPNTSNRNWIIGAIVLVLILIIIIVLKKRKKSKLLNQMEDEDE